MTYRLLKTGILFISSLLILAGCQFGSGVVEIDHAQTSDFETISVNVDSISPINMSELFSEIRYVPLETPQGSLIQNIDKLVYQDGRVYIMYDGDVYIFEETGEMVTNFQVPHGIGSGELILPSDFIVHPGSDEFSVYGEKRVNRYRPDGEVVDEFILHVPAAGLGVTPEGNYVFNINNRRLEDPEYENSDYNLIFMDRERNIYQKALEIEEPFVNTRYPVATNFATYRDTLLYYAHPDTNIYEISGDQVAVRYQIDFGSNGIPQSLFDNRPNYNIGNVFNENLLNRGHAAFLDMVQETDHTLFFSFRNSLNSAAHWVFYDKSEGVAHVVNDLVNDIDYGIGPYFLATKDNELIAALHPGDIIEAASLIRQQFSEEELDSYLQQEGNLIELSESLSYEGNPVLMFVRTR